MTEPGERRPPTATPWVPTRALAVPWSRGRAVLVALAAGLAAATVWALLRSILDISIGSIVVAALGGWAIGASLRRSTTTAAAPLATVLAAVGWLTSLLLAWLVAMAILPESTRTFAERLAATPFLDWLLPQLGIVEVGALVAWVAAALVSVRRPRHGVA
jgi:hypothetical protein